MVHDHQDHQMEDANDDQNDNSDQKEVLMNEEELPQQEPIECANTYPSNRPNFCRLSWLHLYHIL